MLAFLWAWMRRHPRIVDGGVAALFFLPNVPYLLSDLNTAGAALGGPAVAAALTFLLCAPLVWRRRWPVRVFAVMAFVAFVQWALDHYLWFADLALLCAAYTVAASSRRLHTVLTFATLELGCLLAALRWAWGAGDQVTAFVMLSVAVVAPMVFGDSVRSRRAYYTELEARAQRLEREREQEAQLAVAEERARIAREMHDVVAHNVSVMVVQAEGAAYLMDADPDRSRTAVQTVAATGRQALAEMRRLLGLLRSGHAPDDDRTPQPGLADVPDLVQRVRSAGLPVAVEMAAETDGVGAGAGLAAYRVVQEGLTNVLKHAGPRAAAEVRVERRGSSVWVSVADDGRGAAADPSDGRGHGLRGMRERVGVYGGTLHAGPCPGGGYRLAAEIPVTGQD